MRPLALRYSGKAVCRGRFRWHFSRASLWRDDDDSHVTLAASLAVYPLLLELLAVALSRSRA